MKEIGNKYIEKNLHRTSSCVDDEHLDSALGSLRALSKNGTPLPNKTAFLTQKSAVNIDGHQVLYPAYSPSGDSHRVTIQSYHPYTENSGVVFSNYKGKEVSFFLPDTTVEPEMIGKETNVTFAAIALNAPYDVDNEAENPMKETSPMRYEAVFDIKRLKDTKRNDPLFDSETFGRFDARSPLDYKKSLELITNLECLENPNPKKIHSEFYLLGKLT